jgi:Mg2+ and Co2+ transporter CorA
MIDTKPWYLSRTIWAAIVTILTALAGLFGVPLEGFDDAAFVDALLQAVAAVAGVIALMGRLFAQSRIG